MWWWWRDACTPISKYWWRVYWRNPQWWEYLLYCINVVLIMDWSDISQIFWNGLILVGVIWINVNRVGIFLIPIKNWFSVIPIHRIFATNIFNFGIIFALRIFENFVASKVFTFTFRCSMPRQSPTGKIWSPAGLFKDVAVVLSIRLWDHGHDGYLWVHPSAVINIPPRYGNINTTIKTIDGKVFTVTLSWYGRLLEVDDGWLNSGFLHIHCVSPEWVSNTYIPSYFSSWQQDLTWLFRTRHPIPIDTFSKRSAHLLVDCQVNLENILLFPLELLFSHFVQLFRNLFNSFARVNCFYCIHTIICLIFAVNNIKIFLIMFLYPISFLL